MVRPDLAQFGREATSTNDVSVMSNALPGVWVGMDHLCIVWCNQLVLAVIRLLFKLVNGRTKQLTSEAAERRRLVEWNLIAGHAKAHTVRLPANWAVPLTFTELWTSRERFLWQYRSSGDARSPSALLFAARIGSDVVVTSRHLKLEPWVYSCAPDDATCQVLGPPSCENLYLPSVTGFFRVFNCRAVGDSHFVIKLPLDDSGKVEVFAESFETANRTWDVSWLRQFIGFSAAVPRRSLYASIAFPHLSNVWDAFLVEVRVSGRQCPVLSAGAVRQHVPWSGEDTFTVIDRQVVEHTVVIFQSKPDGYRGQPLELQFFLHPQCEYVVSLVYSVTDALEQVARYYIAFCPTFFAVSLQQRISLQLRLIDVKVIFFGVASFFKWIMWIVQLDVRDAPLVRNLTWLSDRRCESLVACLFVYFACNYVVFVGLALVKRFTVFAQTTPLARITIRLDVGHGYIRHRPFVLVCALGLFAYFTCGAVAVYVVQVLCAVKMFLSHAVTLQSAGALQSETTAALRSNLYANCYLLWALMALFAGHLLVVWTVNVRLGWLTPDPMFTLSLALALTLLRPGDFLEVILEQRKKYVKVLAYCQYALATCTLLFGLEHFPNVTWTLAANCILLSYWPFVAGMVFPKDKDL